MRFVKEKFIDIGINQELIYTNRALTDSKCPICYLPDVFNVLINDLLIIRCGIFILPHFCAVFYPAASCSEKFASKFLVKEPFYWQ